jgi:2-keto-4-pentenoate hydratase/2-oxohepta-3-ene-1,7-dioic acid hydratase in catechol pathway
MRYAMFSTIGAANPRLGVMHNDRMVDVQALLGGTAGGATASLLALVESGGATWREVATQINTALPAKAAGASQPLDAIRWHAPIPRPRKNVVCLGLNYASHAKETSTKIPTIPIFFTKSPTSVTGPGDPVPWQPSATEQIDYEAELGVVIGVGGKNISRAKALEHVFGYTAINDVSARDLQFGHKQWFKGKSLDGFCPMGPVVVTADEFGDPQKKRISLRLNGEVRQNATTADMIFSVDLIIEFLSNGMTIDAGDVIATGTPEGVGLGRTPPEYMKDGDLMEVDIEGIGVLRNRLVRSAGL